MKIRSNSPIKSEHSLVKQPELHQFFADIGLRLETGKIVLSANGQDVKQLFSAVSSRIARAEKQQQKLDCKEATRFNLFDLIQPDENKLSDILKLLLDPKGEHGQGDLFLRLLIEKLDIGLTTKHTQHALVEREAPTHGIEKYRRRIDVLAEAGDWVAIENKVDSSEQPEQVKDYLGHLRYCTRGNGHRFVLIYLTPEGRRPDSLNRAELDEAVSSGSLRCWSYQLQLREWLVTCRSLCNAPRMQFFLSDFIAYIESHLKREPKTNDEE
jgi:DNA-directed RNA polymerase subunit N (RpoN/RPB10)